MPESQWSNSRKVAERIIITGTLRLDTPAHLGNGDAEGLTDISLARDLLDGRPLLTGASIAGALRNYLREYERGFGQVEQQDSRHRPKPGAEDPLTLAEQVFGYVHRARQAAVQSWLMVADALGEAAGVELRDGVAIDAATRTASDQKKYDIELLAAGTTFPLEFELWLEAGAAESERRLAGLVTALRGLERGEIGLGTRKRRGLGRCHVEGWHYRRFAMDNPKDLCAWLKTRDYTRLPQAQPGLPDALAVEDKRRELRLTAAFAVESSLLIRSETGVVNGADMVHLRSRRNGQDVPVLSGTSLAGALRSRALRIARTMLKENGAKLVDAMFGQRIEKAGDLPSGSQVLVRETEIKGGVPDQVQSRVKIDHFTGGAYPGGLFSQQPVWSLAGHEAGVELSVRLRRAAATSDADFQAQMGLLLLVLKDLWTGDLPLGGESSVGRGRLLGRGAVIELGGRQWDLNAQGAAPAEAAPLEACVQAFLKWAPAEGAAGGKP